MYGSYDLSIVALSVAVAILASYTALDMASRVSASDSTPRKSWIWLVAGAVSMGSGIWSMHFIGMLSFHLPIQVAFDLPITLLESGKKSGVLCSSEQRRGWLKDRVEGQRRQVGLVPEPLS
ncbi:MAG: MHYT domain-containing protein [Methylocella sp.]